jgi:uncharacterized membrane protein (DUF106 family)
VNPQSSLADPSFSRRLYPFDSVILIIEVITSIYTMILSKQTLNAAQENRADKGPGIAFQ